MKEWVAYFQSSSIVDEQEVRSSSNRIIGGPPHLKWDSSFLFLSVFQKYCQINQLQSIRIDFHYMAAPASTYLLYVRVMLLEMKLLAAMDE